MSTVYRLKASELNQHFLEQIKPKFADKEIEIIVSEFDETENFLKVRKQQKPTVDSN